MVDGLLNSNEVISTNNSVEEGEREESHIPILKEKSKDEIPTRMLDIWIMKGYDINIDCCGFKTDGMKWGAEILKEKLDLAKNMMYPQTVTDKTWDTAVKSFIESWETILDQPAFKGMEEMLTPTLLKALEATKASHIQRMKNTTIREKINWLKKTTTSEEHPRTLGAIMNTITNEAPEKVTDEQMGLANKYLDFFAEIPKGKRGAVWSNMVVQEEYQLDMNTKEFKEWDHNELLAEIRNKYNLKKIGANTKPQTSYGINKVTQVYKNNFNRPVRQKKVYRDEALKYFKMKGNTKFLPRETFRIICSRTDQGVCVCCGKARDHEWKTCSNNDLRLHEM